MTRITYRLNGVSNQLVVQQNSNF